MIFIMAGIITAGVIILIGYHNIGRFAWLWYGLCLLLLIYLIMERLTGLDVPFVRQQRAAWRWIRLGPVTLQPSELMKITYVLMLAWYLRYRRNYRTFAGLIMPFVLALIPMALIKLQPDLGTVLLFLPVLFAMLFAAGAKLKHLMAIIALGVACLPLFWLKIEPYQRLRLAGVVLQNETLRSYLLDDRPDIWEKLRPPDSSLPGWRKRLTHWRTDTGFQLVRSKTAIGSGGVLGVGWGEGIFVDHKFLPERHNDFIFAIIGHQWGFVGCLVVIMCYVLLVLLGLDVATVTNDPFGRLVAVGMTMILAVQALTNLAMTVGLGPITGVTLPFISAGGSSMIASFICIGFLVSVTRRGPVFMVHKSFEFNEEEEKYRRIKTS
jgi:cell division protein FtsW (lipid II flippase)